MSDDAVRVALKPFADEMADVIKKHLRACPGFSFHPVFIDAAAYEPMIDVLEKAVAAHRARTLAGAGEVERKLRSPIVTKSIGPGVRNAVKARLMKEAADLIAAQRERIAELEGKVRISCGHYSRRHNTGGWVCPDCGARGPVGAQP